jgi:Flp pilus assembly protein TadD
MVTAIKVFQRCLALAPNHAAAAYNLRNALRQAGKPVDAIAAFLRCLRLVPDFGPAYVNLADTLRHLGLLEQARVMADFGMQHVPDLPEVKICLANVLYDDAEYEAAAALYTEVLARLPGHAGALGNLGNTLRAMRRLPEALAAHDRAVTAAPNATHFRFERAMNPARRERLSARLGRVRMALAEPGKQASGLRRAMVRRGYRRPHHSAACRAGPRRYPAVRSLRTDGGGTRLPRPAGGSAGPRAVAAGLAGRGRGHRERRYPATVRRALSSAKPATCVRHKAGDDPSRGSLSARRPGGGGRMADENPRQWQSPRRSLGIGLTA